jgi:anaerobic magnesium-protoporphyrin IX monomethyl ester cyclase
MIQRPARVLLVGFQDQDNLGLRYLASSLRDNGHEVRIESLGKDPGHLIYEARQWVPDIIGFSLIFQFMAPDFAKAVMLLREAGIKAHYTIGGHYASFEPAGLFQLISGLDSIVMFEGEQTLVDLADSIAGNRSWHVLNGIAWRNASGVHINENRKSHKKIDELSWPERGDINYGSQALPNASMLASRGCPWNCSFCSIVNFYAHNGTPGRRLRDPVHVVDEMEYLVRERGVRLILFQDDDFLAKGTKARDWAITIAGEIKKRDLQKEMRFKISCRTDEIDEQTVALLIDAGLAHVYLGIEAGDTGALLSLNKQITPDVHFRACETLRRFNLSFDFGFMLLDPWSTISSVRNNMKFLEEICRGGYVVASYCRTLPYAGTPLEKKMRTEGRLTGPSLEADYHFMDPALDVFWDFSLVAFHDRNYCKDATAELLKGLLFQARLDYPDRPHDPDFQRTVQMLVSASNNILFTTAKEGLDFIENEKISDLNNPELINLARFARQQDMQVRGVFNSLWKEHHYVTSTPG